MKQSVIGIAVALVASTVMTSAQADNDKGFYLGIGAGAYNTDLQLKGGGTTITMGDTQHDAGANLFLGYNFDMNNWRLGTELSYTNSYGNIEDWSGGGARLKGKLENGWAVSILPTVKLSKETAGFVRLGYGNVKGVADASVTVSGTTYTGTASEKFNAALWGFGMEHAINDRTMFRLEYQFLDVKGKTVSNIEYLPRATGLSAGVRFSF